MENDTPQPQPRRQRARSGPTIAGGNVDPCVIYLEARETDEDHILFACWARSSTEVREVGQKPQLKLTQVLVVIGSATKSMPSRAFTVYEEGHLLVESEAAGTQNDLRLFVRSGKLNLQRVRGEIRYIDRETDLALERLVSSKPSMDDPMIILRILDLGPMEWPSVKSAMVSLLQLEWPENTTPPREPTEGELQYQRGEEHFKKGEYKRALQELQGSLKYNEVRYQALNLMGLSLMKAGLVDLAARQFRIAESELTEMDEIKKEIAYNLGLAYEATSCPDKALKQWKKIYEYDMSFRDVAKRVEDSYGGDEGA